MHLCVSPIDARMVHAGFHDERGDTHKRVSPVVVQTSGFNSPSIVGISSDTVGWMCTARWITV
jgi:hypothetical protein